LLARQDGLDDRRLRQREPQQFVHRGVVQTFALGDLAAVGHRATVEQVLPVERPRQRPQQGLIVLRGDLASGLDLAIRPHHHLAGAALSDLQRDERGQLDLPAIPALAGDGFAGGPNACFHVHSSSSCSSAPIVPDINSAASSCQP
jgi:hypothetical protein